jgi:hypothetical protein
MVKEVLISDIELRLSGGSLSDDSRVSRRQIGHWLDVIRDRLVVKEIDERQEVNSDYYEIDENLDIVIQEVDNEPGKRYYVELSKLPLSSRSGREMGKVMTTDKQIVYKTTLSELSYVRNLHFAKPSQTNPVYYRLGIYLYIDGLTDRIADDFNIHAYYIPSYASSSPAETDEFKISAELVPMLLDLVEETARREIQIEQDFENDGQ